MGLKQEAFRGQTPSYRQTQEGGLPSLPNKPRTPHFPHTRAVAAGVILALAGTAAVINTPDFRENNTNPDPRPGAVDPEQMMYPYGEQPLNLSISPNGELVSQISTDPQVLKSENNYFTPVLGNEYGKLNDPENRFGHVNIVMLNEIMSGGIWLQQTNAEGSPIFFDQNNEPILIKPSQIENLTIPEQAPVPVIG